MKVALIAAAVGLLTIKSGHIQIDRADAESDDVALGAMEYHGAIDGAGRGGAGRAGFL